MNNMLKGLLLVGLMSVSVGSMAGVTGKCNSSSKWWPLCLNDPSTGPDIGTAEHARCQAKGGCSKS